jgi:iron complex transport system permease protein
VSLDLAPAASPALPRIRRPSRVGLAARPSTRGFGLALALALLGLTVLGSLAYGARSMPVLTAWDAFAAFDPQSQEHLIIRSLRLPRTMIGVAVGAALGLAGGVMQGVTRNPLADPGILGVNAGASVGVVLAIHVLGVGSAAGWVVAAMAGALGASVLVYGLGSRGRGGATPVKLALAGAAATALLGSLTSAIILADQQTLDQFRFWRVGSLAGRDLSLLAGVAPVLLVGALLALALGRVLNALSLGEDVATSLGQRVGLVRAACAVAVVLLVGGAVAVAGPIGFVGLVIPHVARAITGPDYRWVLAYAAVLAPTMLLGADVVGRLVVRPGELQVGIVTALVGAPFFIALVRRRKLADL